jgi:hypothetical protein
MFTNTGGKLPVLAKLNSLNIITVHGDAIQNEVATNAVAAILTRLLGRSIKAITDRKFNRLRGIY